MPNYVPGQDDIYGHDASLEVFTSPQIPQQFDQIDAAQNSSEPFDLFGFEPVFLNESEGQEFEDSIETQGEVDPVDLSTMETRWMDDAIEVESNASDTNELVDEQTTSTQLVIMQQVPRNSLVQSIRSSLETSKQHKAQRHLELQERNRQQQLQYEQMLRDRLDESDSLYIEVANSLEFTKKYPTLVSPNQNNAPLFTDRELQRLTLPKIINDAIANELSVQLMNSADDASLASEQQTVALLNATAKQLNTKRKNILDNIDPQARKAFDSKVVDTVYDMFEKQQIAATEKYVHNPYPVDGMPHRVFAFNELGKLIGFNSEETTIDNDGQQPAVISRIVAYEDGRIEVDPNIDGVGKMYAALNNFTFYERHDGVPDPRNVSGIVDQQMQLANDTPGYFVAHMQQGSIAPDVINDNPHELAFYVKYPVNPVLVTSDMETKIMLKTLDTAISESQFAKPVSHPIDLAFAAVIGQVSFALPRERELVKAAMEADAQAQATRESVHKKQLAAMQSPTLLALSGVQVDTEKNS